MNKKVSRNVKRIINEKGIKQKYIAETLGITQPKLSRMVNGSRKPDPVELYKISKILNVDINDFFKGVE